ncbi:hypothetical protein ACHAXA_008191 [Cyclostephanos tholiformis]|uniref:Uncharacterized protein n=1 Tax=Cyclostephanos tholiformis TaxID=382380 RepID=A0ABD3SCR7_9STRA
MVEPPRRTRRLLLAFLVPLTIGNHSSSGLSEEDRVDEYRARGHAWPPRRSDYVPPDPGWSALLGRRFDQLSQIVDIDAKYNGYMSVVHSALLAPNFTEYGWGLTRAPSDLVRALEDNLKRGLESKDTPEEYQPFGVLEEYPLYLPLMIPNVELNRRAMVELKDIHEAWSGISLVPNNAYGLRVYRNQSKLLMHVDESRTHVISSILHVGHDPDGVPWPLIIEDLHGNTNEVYLEAGDMLLYESSKCFHGRPTRYIGGWYSSLFTHYYPVDWDADSIVMDAHYRVPPEWNEVPEERKDAGRDEGASGGDPTELVVTETSFNEPDCEHGWCNLVDTIKWERPEGLEFGQVLSGDGKVRSLGLDSPLGGEEEL